MSVSSNFHPPLICCSKSAVLNSPPYPPKSKPGESYNVSTSPSSVPLAMDRDSSEEKVKLEQDGADDEKVDILLKSCLRKPALPCRQQACRGSVKWMDLVGKELTEIREFEPSEHGDSDDDIDGNASCSCTIQ